MKATEAKLLEFLSPAVRDHHLPAHLQLGPG